MKCAMLHHGLLVASTVLLLATDAGEAGAQAWDPAPNLPAGEHLALKPGLDGADWDSLRNCLRGFDSRVGARYFAAVVEVTSPDGSPSPESSDAVPYADALYQAWLPGGRLDPATHVLTVLSLRNRGVAVHPGKRWADLGFEGAAIGRAIDASSFGDYARSGDYGLALCDLALTIDRQLAALAAASAPGPGAPAQSAAGVELGPPPSAGRDKGGWLGGFLLAGVFGFVVLGLLALVRYTRRGRLHKRVSEELARWKEKIEVAAERVLAIETEHPLYFATTAERWTGESRALDQEAAEAVNHVFLLYSKAYELHDRAARLVEGAGGRGGSVAALEEAWKLLRETEVRLETGEAEDRRRIFLPLQREYRGASANLLDDLGAAYGAAYDKLARVVEVAQKARALAEAGGRAAAAALEASSRRGELGLPVEHLKAALDPLLERRLEADRLVATDPVAAAGRLQEVIAELDAVAEQARSGNAAALAVRGPIQELGTTLRAEVARLRREGFRLAEPGFDPDLRLDHGVGEARRIEDLLAAGQEEKAVRLRTSLEEGLTELGEQLAASEAARAEVPAKLDQLVASRSGLAGRMPGAEAVLRSLAAEHAAESFREEADNLKELEQLLGRLEEWFEQIREDHKVERYLSALADLEKAEGLLAEGARLVDAIGEIEKQLAAARDGAKELAYRSQQLLGRLDELAGPKAPGLGAELRRAISDLVGRATASLEEAAGPRPQWLALEAALGGIEKELGLTVAQVEEELAAYGESERLARELEGRLAGLERQVAAENRDREHVARAVDDAARQLTAWRARLAEPDFSGSELLRQGRELTASGDSARGVFEAEMDLVRQAEARFRAAAALLQQIDGRGFGYGIVADCGAGRQGLRQVEEALASRDWEAALSLAAAAQERIEDENRRCRDRAQMLEQEARRRLVAQRTAEQLASVRRAAGAFPPIGPRMTGPAGPAIGSSRSSFGSRLGRSISAGRSFGGSRSGGSRW